MTFILLKKDNPCPICDRDDGRCRQVDKLVLCMTVAERAEIPGWRFLGQSKDWLWGKWAPDNRQEWTEQQRQQWQQEQAELKRQREQQQQQRAAESMPVAERDRWYRLLLDELNLNPIDRADLRRRGLSDELIAGRGYRSVAPGQRLTGHYPANLPGVTDGRVTVGGAGYLIPALTVNGEIAGFQIRLRDAQSGRYRWMSSAGNPANLPNGELPITVAYPAIPNPDRAGWLGFSEGILKPQIAADRLGFPVIGASGGNFGGSSAQIQAAIAHLKPTKLVLLPDGGALNNAHVLTQYERLAALVPGIEVFWWEQIEKGSADPDEISPETLANAELLSWQAFQSIARAQTSPLPPNLHIGTDEFINHVGAFPKSGVLAFHGGTGTAKGKAIAALLQGHSWLSVTTLRSLARDQAAGWKGTFINDGKVMPGDGAVACVPSLLKAHKHQADILVIDETPTVLEFALSSRLANKAGQRSKTLDELERRVKSAKLVILASADLDPQTLAWVEEVRGDRAFIVRSDRTPLAWMGTDYSLSPEQFLLFFEQQVQRLPTGKLAILNCDSKQDADRISALLNDQGMGNLLITSDTSGGEIEAAFLASKGRELPGLVASGVKAIVTSPSVKEGFSVECHTDLIDSVWLIARGGSIGAAAIAQTLDRVRSELIPRHLWIANKGRAYSPYSAAETVPKFMREFRSVSRANAKLTMAALTAQALEGVEGIDWNSDRLKLFAHFETRRNRDMAGLRDAVWSILEARGKQRRLADCPVAAGAAAAMRDRLKAIRQRLEKERAERIAKAESLTEWQFEKLERKENPTPDEILQLEKYYLEAFYRQPMTADDVLWDCNGDRRQHIRRLEQILNPDQAVQHSTRKIEESPHSPQDWSKAALQSNLIERSGAGDLIRGILAGAIVQLGEDAISPVANHLKLHPQQFALAFNFRNLETVSDRQAVSTLLDWCGLQRVCDRRRLNGKIVRQYAIDVEHLQALKAVIERRLQGVTPPLKDPIKEGGVTPLNLNRWLDPDCLADVKGWWQQADSPELFEAIKRIVPPEVLERAIAS